MAKEVAQIVTSNGRTCQNNRINTVRPRYVVMNDDVRHSYSGGALDGIRVLDLSRVLADPWATQILGDFGAHVLKVERPGQGDDTRDWGPPFISSELEDSDAAYFTCCNR